MELSGNLLVDFGVVPRSLPDRAPSLIPFPYEIVQVYDPWMFQQFPVIKIGIEREKCAPDALR
jgi:hypothetical protein